MRALVQRVSEAGVYIDSENYKAEIKKGMVILLGIKTDGKVVLRIKTTCSSVGCSHEKNLRIMWS